MMLKFPLPNVNNLKERIIGKSYYVVTIGFIHVCFAGLGFFLILFDCFQLNVSVSLIILHDVNVSFSNCNLF